MFTPMILTIPALVVPLVMSPDRDCQFGRTGDPTTDEQAVIMFELKVDEYAAIRRWPAIPWPPAHKGTFFTPAVSDVFRFRIAQALRADDEESGGVLAALPPLPPVLEYKVVGRNVMLVDVQAFITLDTLDLALPERFDEFDPAVEPEPAVGPFFDEPGCLYGPLEDLE